MFGTAVAGSNLHRLAVEVTQGLEFVHKLLPHLVLAAVRAVKLFGLKVRYERPVHDQPPSFTQPCNARSLAFSASQAAARA